MAVSLMAVTAPAWCQTDRSTPATPRPSTTPTGTHLDLCGDLGYTFGETEYIYDQTVIDQGVAIRLKSQLEFPLDAPLLGVRGQLRTGGNGRPLTIEATLHASLTDPTGTMYDHDWVWGLGDFDGKFGYTESHVTGRLWQVGTALSWYLEDTPRLAIGPHAGYRYQHIAQDVIDFIGWQIDFEQPPYQPRAFRVDELGIVYRISYHMIVLGADARLRVADTLSLTLRGGLVPFHFSDFDDHVLRFKTAVASGWGRGGLAQLDVRWSDGEAVWPVLPVVSARLDVLALSANGPQTQSWYGDDPASQGDDTGTTITDLPHEVHSTQYHLMLGIGAAF